MGTKERLISEIEKVPDSLLDEVLDFVKFLKAEQIAARMHTAIASETSLGKDWLRPEEDDAWQHL